MVQVRVAGISAYFPPDERTSHQVEELIRAHSPGVQVPHGIIESVTGIRTRRVAAEDVNSSDLAAEAGVSPAQLALAWVSSRGHNVVPIPGTTNVDHLREIIAVADLAITPDILERAGQLIDTPTVSGPRYSAQNTAEVDAETFEDAA